MLQSNAYLKEGERIDDLMIKNLGIIQNPEVFCFGMDAVLLSSFTKVFRGESCVDLCCGNGIIPILLYAKKEGDMFCGIELQNQLADMAIRSIKYNNIEKNVKIIEGDIREISKYLGAGSFDVVTVNPPYIKGNHGIENKNDIINIARHEKCCDIEDVAKAAKKVLKPKGRLYMVHRPSRLVEILKVLSDNRLEPKEIRMVQPFVDKSPNLVLIEARKDGGSELIIKPPLVVYRKPGEYTDELLEIYGKND